MIGKAPKHIAEGLFLWAIGGIGGIGPIGPIGLIGLIGLIGPIMLLEPILQRRGITKFR